MLLQSCSLAGMPGCNDIVQDLWCEDVENADGHLSNLTTNSVAKDVKLCFDGRYKVQQLHSGTRRSLVVIPRYSVFASVNNLDECI
jgi:hypothetical protein